MNAHVAKGDADRLATAISKPWAAAQKPTRLLLEFQETIRLLNEKRHGFGAIDLAEVEACRGYSDGNFFWDGSFLVRLKDGRRAQLISGCDEGDWENTGTIDIAMVAAGGPCETLTQSNEASPFPWEQASHLNEFLHLLQAESAAR